MHEARKLRLLIFSEALLNPLRLSFAMQSHLQGPPALVHCSPMTTASADVMRHLPNLWQHFDAGQAAQQIAGLATDLGCAVDCVRFVLRELSKVNMTATNPFCSFIATTVDSLSHLLRYCSATDPASCCP